MDGISGRPHPSARRAQMYAQALQPGAQPFNPIAQQPQLAPMTPPPGPAQQLIPAPQLTNPMQQQMAMQRQMSAMTSPSMQQPFAVSDRRMKVDEKEIGRLMLPNGELPLKTFRFKGDPVRRMGFVAQDVAKVHPEAVYTHPRTGVMGINYARLLLAAHHHAMGGSPRNGNGDNGGFGQPQETQP